MYFGYFMYLSAAQCEQNALLPELSLHGGGGEGGVQRDLHSHQPPPLNIHRHLRNQMFYVNMWLCRYQVFRYSQEFLHQAELCSESTAAIVSRVKILFGTFINCEEFVTLFWWQCCSV